MYTYMRRYCIIYLDRQEFKSNLTNGFRDVNEIRFFFAFINFYSLQ